MPFALVNRPRGLPTVQNPEFDAYLARSLPIGDLPALPTPPSSTSQSLSISQLTRRDAKLIGLSFAASLPAFAIVTGVAVAEREKRS
jgi:hypothetical protein